MVAQGGPEKAESSSEKTSEKTLAYLQIRPDATIAELADKAGVSTRSVERNPRSLRLSGCLKRVGPDRGGHWDVVR